MTERDQEIDAMKAIKEALEPLDNVVRGRVLNWAFSRFQQTFVGNDVAEPMTPSAGMSAGVEGGAFNAGVYETFADLFDAINPSIERDKALVAAYWSQVCKGMPNFPAQVLNDDLKDLGHGVGNITEALNQLKSERPALILQLKKSGTSKQARKIYKLTQEGIKRIHSIMREDNFSNESF
jgi:hypothetical protein